MPPTFSSTIGLGPTAPNTLKRGVHLNCDGSDDILAWTRHAFKEAAREAGILVEE
jgi:hypothetical protein